MTAKIESIVKKTIKDWKLLSNNDRILVAASGGKDSTAVLSILSNLFDDVQAITIDAAIGNYSNECLLNVKSFCNDHAIKLHVVSFREQFGYSLCYLQSVLRSKGLGLNSCAICGVLKRYLLNRKSREIKASVLVTGHNMDDEAQSIVMNLLRANLLLLSRLGPRTGAITNPAFVPRVKPLYFVQEKLVESYSRSMLFPVKYSRCPCSAESYRNSVRNLLSAYEQKHPGTTRAIIDYFLGILPQLRRSLDNNDSVNCCESCGEPAKGSVCKACQLIAALRKG
ncbi:MAG: TIGR00269 family protein [Candidatus Woesearchaeota archaeon]